jgi:glycine cleavage system regulatory protein
MQESLVVTLIGADRPGIVAQLAAVAADCGAGWEESKMARLAGRFAGIVRLEVDSASLEPLERALGEMKIEGIRLTVDRGSALASRSGTQWIKLELVGHDRRGIVRDVSAALARHRVSIDELDTDIEDASMAGGALFRARAWLRLLDDVDLNVLRTDLEAIADDLMVELTLDVRPSAAPIVHGA